MKKKEVNYNYGECEICNTAMKERLVKQDFWIQGKLIVVEDVPAGVCPNCGEKVVKADVGRSILKLVDTHGLTPVALKNQRQDQKQKANTSFFNNSCFL
jgi:YgiT-type zinc finger domain-containing protein